MKLIEHKYKKTFLGILHYSYLGNDELRILYNEMWENELKVMLQLIKKIIGEKLYYLL